MIGTWNDVAEILNSELEVSHDESTYRKKYNALKAKIQELDIDDEDDVNGYPLPGMITETDGEIAKLRQEQHRLYQEKCKLRDERNELNKALRKEARWEELSERLIVTLSSIGEKRYPRIIPTPSGDGDTMIACLSDLHIGLRFASVQGYYDIDQAKENLNKYMSEIMAIGELHKVSHVIVVGLGDYISGSCHTTIAIANQENVVEQIKTACEMVADFLYNLSKVFEGVEFISVSGNHSRLTKKDEALTDERVDSLIPWFASQMLMHVDNIQVYDSVEKDSTFCQFDVGDKTYIGVHGDYDGMSDASISKLVLWLGYRPYAILMGHKHYPAMTEVANIVAVQSGSLCGAGDDFTREKRLAGKPSQTVLVCNEDGSIKAMYPVSLL